MPVVKVFWLPACRRLRRPRYMQDAFGAARGETGHPLSLAYNLVTLLYVMMHVIFYVLAIYNLRLMFVSTAIPDQKPGCLKNRPRLLFRD